MTRVIWALVLICLTGPAMACQDMVAPRVLTTEDPDAPDAYIDVGPVAVSAPFGVVLVFCTDQPVSPDSVSFDATMPAHMHGMNYDPEVAALGPNRFEVSNIVFHMPGLWRVDVRVDQGRTARLYQAEIVVD